MGVRDDARRACRLCWAVALAALLTAVLGTAPPRSGGTPTTALADAAQAAGTVTFASGWNLVSAPAGTVLQTAVGPLYTYQPGDTAYEQEANGTPLLAGRGYWAYFAVSTTVTLAQTSAASAIRQLPAGQFVLIGNPTQTPSSVVGADVVYTYSASGGYQATNMLAPGQGAWAFSIAGGQVLIGPPPGNNTGLERCHTTQLAIGFVSSQGAAGHLVDTFQLTNLAATPCTLYGFVGAQMLDAQGQALPTQVVRNGGFFTNQPGPSQFSLDPGAAAQFLLEWSDVPTGNETTCPSAAQLELTPPDETTFSVLDVAGFSLAPCNAGTLDITPVRAPGTPLS